MILQEGRYYRARSGSIYGPLVRVERTDQPFECQFAKECWGEDGSYYTAESSSNHDLISEVTCLVVDPFHALASPDATPKVDRVVLASKILIRLAPDLTPSMAARQALQYADAFLKEIEND
jgi:hypothetical protein